MAQEVTRDAGLLGIYRYELRRVEKAFYRGLMIFLVLNFSGISSELNNLRSCGFFGGRESNRVYREETRGGANMEFPLLIFRYDQIKNNTKPVKKAIKKLYPWA